MTNATCWKEAQRVLVGGVNSPVRCFKAVGGKPIFADQGRGAYLWDVEGTRYLDYVSSWGALILGHRPPVVLKAVHRALKRGFTFGTPTRQETALAREITQAFPSMEQVRFVTSGTEAAMSALRLARAATGQRKILKFDGAYHGHLDSLLTKSGSGMATLGIPSSAGVPMAVTQDTITIPFNDDEALLKAIGRYRKELAAVLVEPILANVGVIPPKAQFLSTLRRITKENGILLIFDEVITGFRVSYGGAQRLYGIKPDLTLLGKVIGGGFPIGAYGGSRNLMQLVAPAGPVYQAGTLAGHPIAMAAGLTTLEILKRPGTYKRLDASGEKLEKGLLQISRRAGVPAVVNRVGSLLSIFFTDHPVRNGQEAKKADPHRYARYFHGMLSRGIYLPPSSFESWFISTAHGEKEVGATLRAHQKALTDV